MDHDRTYYEGFGLDEFRSPMICQKVAMQYFKCLEDHNIKKPIDKKVCTIERKSWIDTCERPFRFQHIQWRNITLDQ